jgi:hypothetical protein
VNTEDQEHAMDAQFHIGHTIWQTDLYDSQRDARSEGRYEDDPRAEPEQYELAHEGAYLTDEQTGFRG